MEGFLQGDLDSAKKEIAIVRGIMKGTHHFAPPLKESRKVGALNLIYSNQCGKELLGFTFRCRNPIYGKAMEHYFQEVAGRVEIREQHLDMDLEQMIHFRSRSIGAVPAIALAEQASSPWY
ncbi:uncharacterized protein MCYG_04311 [Microsporum canis CBS 113480]|uniref:Uncharacterized protein n=1 Tax=Arthroderma otae (strain ATCC MYA-4605 / CBS 113480) TaxID=554155 RepID=C5FPH6_ARTOC|nr:uncharacterized protein MCYG_04311 [Microsporum canis CBS 113480]EEQ31492.1 predicted protein [Microsporum canis CBS 113480]